MPSLALEHLVFQNPERRIGDANKGKGCFKSNISSKCIGNWADQPSLVRAAKSQTKANQKRKTSGNANRKLGWIIPSIDIIWYQTLSDEKVVDDYDGGVWSDPEQFRSRQSRLKMDNGLPVGENIDKVRQSVASQ